MRCCTGRANWSDMQSALHDRSSALHVVGCPSGSIFRPRLLYCTVDQAEVKGWLMKPCLKPLAKRFTPLGGRMIWRFRIQPGTRDCLLSSSMLRVGLDLPDAEYTSLRHDCPRVDRMLCSPPIWFGIRFRSFLPSRSQKINHPGGESSNIRLFSTRQHIGLPQISFEALSHSVWATSSS